MKLNHEIKKKREEVKQHLLKNYSKREIEALNWLESGNDYLESLIESFVYLSSKEDPKDTYEKILRVDALCYILSAHEEAIIGHKLMINSLRHKIAYINGMPQDEKKEDVDLF